jgi:hypothetical protein
VLAFAVIALALSPEAAAEISCALALATEGGISVGVVGLASALSLSAAFLVSADFDVAPEFLRWA